MCILIVKPKGKLVPSDEILKECFKNNPDGAGFSYNKDNCIVIRKGFMTVDEFIKATKKIPVESTAIIHCRIGTSGGNSAGMTHPYPLCNDYDRMQKTSQLLKASTDKKVYSVGHNGIFYGMGNDKVNDTCVFIANLLKPLNNHADILCDDYDAVINTLVSGSKIAILDNDGRCKRYGNGWVEDNGIYYSNTTYKPKYTYNSSCSNNWGDFIIKKYGSYEKYYEYLDGIELQKIKELKDKYPAWSDEIDEYANQGFYSWQIRNWICADEQDTYSIKTSSLKDEYED